MGAELAASKLKDGIVHLTIDQLEKAESNEDKLTRGDINRLWEALIDGACKKDCGCAQVLRQHVSLPHLRPKIQRAERFFIDSL